MKIQYHGKATADKMYIEQMEDFDEIVIERACIGASYGNERVVLKQNIDKEGSRSKIVITIGDYDILLDKDGPKFSHRVHFQVNGQYDYDTEHLVVNKGEENPVPRWEKCDWPGENGNREGLIFYTPGWQNK